MGRGQTLFLQQREKWAHHGGWIPFNHQLLIVPAPGFTLLLSASQLLTAILLSKGQERAMRFLVRTQVLAECQLSQLALNRPSLLQRRLAKPKLACSVFKTCFYLKTNS